jgi:RNA polymerase-associated protein RTF1
VEDEDSDWGEVKSWNRSDLMGNEKDRSRLFKMTELEREMVLADRRKKIEQLEEKQALKQRIISQSTQKLTEKQKKGQSLEKLRKKREKKNSNSRPSRGEASEKKNRTYSSEESESENEFYENDKDPKITLNDALKIQIKRDDIEQWLQKPMFQKTIRGCLVRISIGSTPDSREPIYRCCYIQETPEYHRKYKVNKATTNLAMDITHGKAAKQYLFDVISNQPISAKEWLRYETTHKVEKLPLPTKNHLSKKLVDLDKLRAHRFTNEDINDIIADKKRNNHVGNRNLEVIRLKHQLDAARDQNDFEKEEEILKQIEYHESIGEFKTPEVDLIAQLNQRNRELDLKEGRDAEIAALAAKRKKGICL